MSNIYLLKGNSTYLQDIYIKKLKTNLQGNGDGDFDYENHEQVESLGRIIDAANLMPFFSAKRLIIINDHKIFKPGVFSEMEYKYAMDYLDNPSPYTVLVFITDSNVDKRGKLYKKVVAKAKTINCESPKGANLSNWINKEFLKHDKKADHPLINILATMSKGDLYFLTNEINKICTFIGKKELVRSEDVQDILAQTLDAGIFKMRDYLAEKDLKNTLKELEGLLGLGEPLVLINYMLAMHFRQMLQVLIFRQKGYPEKLIWQKTGGPQFVITKLIRQSRSYTQERLVNILRILYELDLKLKSSSSDGRRGMELALAEIINT